MAFINSLRLFKIISRCKNVFWGLLTNLSQLLLGKLIAFGFGPSGIMLFNNLKQLIQIFSSFFTLNSENLVTIQIAKDGFNFKNINLIITRYKFTTIIAVFLLILFLTIKNQYMPSILDSGVNKYLFLISSILFALNIIAFSVLNGVDKLTSAYKNQLAGYFFSLIILFICLNLEVLASQLIVIYFFILTLSTFTLNVCVLKKFYIENKTIYLESTEIKNRVIFTPISVFLIFSVYLTGNCLQFILRNKFVEFYSLESAGLIDSAFTLSNYFTTIVISLFTVNSLSTLSKISDYKNIISLTIKILIMGFVLLLCSNFVLFIFRIDLLKLFYSDEFVLIHNFYGHLIIGDIFKILAGSLMVITLAYGNLIIYAIIAFLGNLCTLVPFIFYKFSDINELGVFYIASNLLFFILSFLVFYSGFKFNGIKN